MRERVAALAHHEPIVVAAIRERGGELAVGERPGAEGDVEVVLAGLQEDAQRLAGALRTAVASRCPPRMSTKLPQWLTTLPK